MLRKVWHNHDDIFASKVWVLAEDIEYEIKPAVEPLI
jgi:hypothetical protein